MMTRNDNDPETVKRGSQTARGVARRTALMLPLAGALSGCGFFDDLFFSEKPKTPGKRLDVMTARRGLTPDATPRRVTLPPPTPRPNSPQAGGTPSHEAGHPAIGDVLVQAWKAKIGEGGGYREKIMAVPVIADGRVYTMDSDGAVSAFLATDGSRLWRTETKAKDDESTNVGGGIGFDSGMLFASTGRAEVMAIDPATGKIGWRKPLPTAARAAPTIADGTLYVPTLDNQVFAIDIKDGSRRWAYQSNLVSMTVLGLPSPAVANGLVIEGFSGGDLTALGTVTGGVSWGDSLASAAGRNSLVDLSAIRGMPVVAGNQVIAVSLGGVLLALDLRSGRRLWDREVASADTPCVAGDWAFILSTDQVVAAVNRNDGHVAWATQLDQYENMVKQKDAILWTGPVLAGDRLLLGGTNKQALAVSPYTGKILGAQELSAKASYAPVIAGGTVYIVSDDGTMIALR